MSSSPRVSRSGAPAFGLTQIQSRPGGGRQRAVGLDGDRRSRAPASSLPAAASSCSSGSPPVQTTNGRRRRAAGQQRGDRRRPGPRRCRSWPPPSPSVPTKSVSQKRQTARRPVVLAAAPQVAAGEPAEHRRPPGLRALALQRVENLLDRVRHLIPIDAAACRRADATRSIGIAAPHRERPKPSATPGNDAQDCARSPRIGYTGRMTNAAFAAARARLPDAPALVAGVREAVWVSHAGEAETLSLEAAAERLRRGAAPIVCHARAVARRLRLPRVRRLRRARAVRLRRAPPASACRRRAAWREALLLPPPRSRDEEAASLFAAARALLAELTASPGQDAIAIAWTMARGGWRWAPAVLAALGAGAEPPAGRPDEGLRVWTAAEGVGGRRRPKPPPDAWPVEPVEARARLVQLLGGGAEPRPQQLEYASHAAAAFAPRERAGEPRLVLAEAGTGIGKTLGYIAPATLWAQKNHGAVWISTYTRNLQRQLDRELDRAYPDLRQKSAQGDRPQGAREPVLPAELRGGAGARCRCAARTRRRSAWSPAGRWPPATATWSAATSRRGSPTCSAPGSPSISPTPAASASTAPAGTTAVASSSARSAARAAPRSSSPTMRWSWCRRRAAPTSRRCRRATSSTRAISCSMPPTTPSRCTSAAGRRPSCGAGCAAPRTAGGSGGAACSERAEDLLDDDRGVGRGARRGAALRPRACPARLAQPARRRHAGRAGRDLPRPGRASRSTRAAATATPPTGWRPRSSRRSRACSRRPPRSTKPWRCCSRRCAALLRALADRLDEEAGAARHRRSGSASRACCRSIRRRGTEPLDGWRAMLRRAVASSGRPEFVDWLAVERIDGREIDVGLYRHWIDPMRPFAEVVLRPAHGALITSATLRDGSGDDEADWTAAESRTGARHLPSAAGAVGAALAVRLRRAAPAFSSSPTSTATTSGRSPPPTASCSSPPAGGGLGLFTAISRLRAVLRGDRPAARAGGADAAGAARRSARRRHADRHLPRRGGHLPARHRRGARRHRRARPLAAADRLRPGAVAAAQPAAPGAARGVRRPRLRRDADAAAS